MNRPLERDLVVLGYLHSVRTVLDQLAYFRLILNALVRSESGGHFFLCSGEREEGLVSLGRIFGSCGLIEDVNFTM